MVDKIKNYTILILFIIIGILLLLKQCNSNNTQKSTIISNKIDTVTTIHIDTIIKYEDKIVTKYIHDIKPISSINIKDTFGLSLCNTLNTYEDSLIDSNISIYNKQIIRGELKQEWIKYDLKVPKFVTINKTITKTITDSIKILIPSTYRFSMYTGLGLGGNNTQFSSIEPYIGIRIKKIYISYGYNLINQTNNLRIGYNILNIK